MQNFVYGYTFVFIQLRIKEIKLLLNIGQPGFQRHKGVTYSTLIAVVTDFAGIDPAVIYRQFRHLQCFKTAGVKCLQSQIQTYRLQSVYFVFRKQSFAGKISGQAQKKSILRNRRQRFDGNGRQFEHKFTLNAAIAGAAAEKIVKRITAAAAVRNKYIARHIAFYSQFAGSQRPERRRENYLVVKFIIQNLPLLAGPGKSGIFRIDFAEIPENRFADIQHRIGSQFDLQIFRIIQIYR